MLTPDQPTKFPRGACPNCGSKNLRRIREGENEAVIVQKRACKDCGAVFSPAVSPLLLLVTAPLALAGFGFAVWAAFINEWLGAGLANMLSGLGVATGFALTAATVMIVKQREPKIHEGPPKEREQQPWDKPQGGE